MIDEKLKPFIMEDVILTDTKLGHGAYGCVIEVKCKGKVFAGKKLKLDTSSDPTEFQKKFYMEYQILNKLHHKHIVRYCGITFAPDCSTDPPILIMEKLMTNLKEFIANPQKFGITNTHLQLKISFIAGIADGLAYLHSRRVIHRDLTATNILLDSSVQVKISDFGNSSIIKMDPSSHLQTLSSVPGTLLYMPPEACNKKKPRYNTQLDIFSFGHLCLFIITDVFPDDLLPPSYYDDDDKFCGRTEVERRQEYFNLACQKIAEDSILIKLTMDCLHNQPHKRPSAADVLSELQKLSKGPL